ncbi:hypothetical protein SY83_01895 [Paenibacillus swuensis]|uniref:Uncharacterized protein n=1 Tax=Paenibacillus swuensis TaxID=1178515 RepID=A0A172TEG6_9BACL|nr:hypothetical protein [Paenibacillus swuensis]ANE45287.1 hypothetical protein SY83_01895 [Paenibacillus swuensis]
MSMFHKTIGLTLLILALLGNPLYSSVANAAAMDLPESTAANLNKLMNAGEAVNAEKLKSAHAEYSMFRQQEIELGRLIAHHHKTNEEALILLRKQIRQIDAMKLAAMQAELTDTKERSKPLYALSESLYKQLKQAKLTKNKALVSQLEDNILRIKPAILLTRQDVKNKETFLKEAKASAYKKIKDLRAMADETTVTYAQLKMDKSVVSSTLKLFSPQMKYLGKTAKAGDSAAALHALRTLTDYVRIVVEKQQRMYTLEQKIGTIISNAQVQLSRHSQ